jgi:hypothetical protein
VEVPCRAAHDSCDDVDARAEQDGNDQRPRRESANPPGSGPGIRRNGNVQGAASYPPRPSVKPTPGRRLRKARWVLEARLGCPQRRSHRAPLDFSSGGHSSPVTVSPARSRHGQWDAMLSLERNDRQNDAPRAPHDGRPRQSYRRAR